MQCRIEFIFDIFLLYFHVICKMTALEAWLYMKMEATTISRLHVPGRTCNPFHFICQMVWWSYISCPLISALNRNQFYDQTWSLNLEPSAHLQERVPCSDIRGRHKFSGEDRWLIGQLRRWLVEEINQLAPGPEKFINTCSVTIIYFVLNTWTFDRLGRLLPTVLHHHHFGLTYLQTQHHKRWTRDSRHLCWTPSHKNLLK